jgi:hypothetical protein
MQLRILVAVGALALVFLSLTVSTGSHEAREPAPEIIRTTGVKTGLCVHLGCGDGCLAAELTVAGNFLVHGLATDGATVARARDSVQSKRLYGQVSVERGSLDRLPYADNLVNLVWRYRAAPLERRIVVRGQLESPWPVAGGVIVVDGLA